MSNIDQTTLPSTNINILYIENNEADRLVTEEILNCFFNKIIISKNGNEALVHLNGKVDLIITDICMPNMKALEIIKKIKEINTYIPIIVLSSHIETSYLLESISLGVDEYLVKPINADDFKEALDRVIKKFQLINKNKLLNDYKNILNKSSILSKIDTNGNFTFVNDKFSYLTGYSKEKLLKSDFNLIHKIKNLNKLLKKLKPTTHTIHGKIKNRRIDNSYFYTKTTVSAIFDENNNIVEYLLIHNDITEEEVTKKSIKKDLKDAKQNLKDAMKLSMQYEMAINESNILSKTNIKGTITFVNDKFCDISGYSKEELIGNNHNLIRHSDMDESVFIELWKTISRGNSWSGIIKNRKKDNSAYWVSTTIIPIKNKHNKIKEYIAIRHDLTKVFELHAEVEDTQREIVYKLGEVGETRSKETGNHVKRVAQYSKDLALLYGLDIKEAQILFDASPMHDIGKVGIPDEILKKPTKLTKEEFDIMKTHAEIGYKLLKGSKRPVLKAAAIVAKEHHEKYDGSGYPRGIKGEDIHIYGRITALADVFDALGSHRYYKKAWEDDRIIDLLISEKGKHFDPVLVDLFMDNLDLFLKTRNKYVD